MNAGLINSSVGERVTKKVIAGSFRENKENRNPASHQPIQIGQLRLNQLSGVHNILKKRPQNMNESTNSFKLQASSARENKEEQPKKQKNVQYVEEYSPFIFKHLLQIEVKP